MRINRRRALKWTGAGLLAPGAFLGNNVWGQNSNNSRPKGYALHIGLNSVDPNGYGGWNGKLKGCVNDAITYEQISTNNGFKRLRLHDAAATSEEVYRHMLWAAKDLKDGDIFLITFAGHGGQIPDTSGDENDNKDETWCLYDRQLIDDELFQLFWQFQSGVRILMISDSCHSGTAARVRGAARAVFDDLKNDQNSLISRAFSNSGSKRSVETDKFSLDDTESRARVLSGQEGDQNAARNRGQRNQENATPLFRDMPEEVILDAYNAKKNKNKYIEINNRGIPRNVRNAVRGTGLLLSGCQDDQLSMESGGNGLFTTVLNSTLQNSHRGYLDFHSAIVRKMPGNQTPNFFPVRSRGRRILSKSKAIFDQLNRTDLEDCLIWANLEKRRTFTHVGKVCVFFRLYFEKTLTMCALGQRTTLRSTEDF